MNFEFTLSNEQDVLPVDDDLVERILAKILEDENAISADISLVILNNERIHDLNRQFLEHDYPTDVLSFPLGDGDSGSEKAIEGEIVVSAEMAKERSEEFHWTAQNELLLYIVHGMLHLCGYDDKSDEKRQRMRIREAEVLNDWGIEIPVRNNA